MEQIRTKAQASIPNLFDGPIDEEPPLKIGTEVFDCTMPSELEFEEEEVSTENTGKPKGEFSIFENKSESERKSSVSSEEPGEKGENPAKIESQYEMLTRSIATFTFHKINSVMLGRPEYAVNSYIPHFLNFKTFPVKFRDEDGQLSGGVSALKLFWKSVVGYVKVELFISTSTIYLLERRKEGLLVRATWSIADLFKLFSDREERKARLVFRTTEGGEAKLVTKQLQEVDLNMLACLMAEAGGIMEVSST